MVSPLPNLIGAPPQNNVQQDYLNTLLTGQGMGTQLLHNNLAQDRQGIADREMKLRERQAQADQLTKEFQNNGERADQYMTSILQGARELKPYLDQNDFQGAQRVLERRRQDLIQRGLSTETTDGAMEALQTNPQQLKTDVDNLLTTYGQPEKRNLTKLGENDVLVDEQGNEVARGLPKAPEEQDTQPIINNLRSRYDKFTADLRDVDAAFRKVQGAPETAAGDVSLIFNYMKMLDPGSTVREGEFANAQDATGVPERIINLYNRTITGERLNPKQREDFVNTARSAFEAQQSSADEQIADLLSQAEQDGVSRERVLGSRALREFEKRAADRLINRKKPIPPDTLSQAQAAIQQGADKEAVKKRLQENGFDVSNF